MSAVLSDCGKYRYSLSRQFGLGDRSVTFIGVNPSTADAEVDDATVRKWIGFAKRWGYDGIEVVNLFAFRSTDVRALATADDPVGISNDRYTERALLRASMVVPCWGSITKIPDALRGRIDIVRDWMNRAVNAPVKCLGYTKHGDPRHPLMLGYDTPLEPWLPLNTRSASEDKTP